MKSSVAITIDGVLRKPGGPAIPEGIRLYKTMAQMYNIILLADMEKSDALDTGSAYALPHQELEHFLRVEQLDAHSKLLWSQRGLSRVAQVSQLRNSGLVLDFVISPLPSISADLMAAGFNVLHFMHAQYTRPSWRPDHKAERTSWDDLVDRETALKLAKANDDRMSE